MVLDESRGLNEHAARPASGVVDLAVERLDHLHDEPDYRLGREELAAAPSLVGCELGEEVLVDEPEGVAGEHPRQRGEEADELEQDALLELLVAARQDAAEALVRGLDCVHREVDVPAEVISLGELGEPGEAGDVWHVEDAAGAEVVGADGPSLGCLEFELGPEFVEAILGEREEDETKDGASILARSEARVRAELVRSSPEPALELGKVSRGHERSG